MKNIFKLSLTLLTLSVFISCKEDDSGINDTPEPNMPPTQPVEWVLDFEDNFNDTELNKEHWAIYDNAGDPDPEHMRRVEAVQVKDGILNCVIDKHPTEANRFMTGGVAHRKNYLYGKFEFKVRMDNDPKSGTGGVCLTWPESETWPKDGENDIYETEYQNNHWNTWIHYGKLGNDGKYNDEKYQYSYSLDKTQWHIVALEWTPDAIKTYVDGKLMLTLRDPEAIAKAKHYICFQVEKNSKIALEKPIRLQVDWVKIYTRVEKK